MQFAECTLVVKVCSSGTAMIDTLMDKQIGLGRRQSDLRWFNGCATRQPTPIYLKWKAVLQLQSKKKKKKIVLYASRNPWLEVLIFLDLMMNALRCHHDIREGATVNHTTHQCTIHWMSAINLVVDEAQLS
jgi:hypothetical protein